MVREWCPPAHGLGSLTECWPESSVCSGQTDGQEGRLTDRQTKGVGKRKEKKSSWEETKRKQHVFLQRSFILVVEKFSFY